MTTDLSMPVHPYTGQTALGWRADGRPIWPIAGGSGEGDPAPAADTGDPGDTGDSAPEPEPEPEPEKDTPAPEPEKDTGGADSAATIARLEKELKAARGEAAKGRVEAKKQAADEAKAALVQDLGKALGLIQDEKAPPPDPAKLTAEIERAQAAHRDTAIELAVFKGAAKHKADPSALTDSRAFMAKLGKLDPADEGFSKKVGEAIKAAVADNPKLTAAGQAPARASGEFSGGTGDKPRNSSTDDIEAHREARRKARS